MSTPRLLLQSLRPATTISRHHRLRWSIPRMYSDERAHDTTADFRSTQKSRVGDLISSMTSDFKPTDSMPANTHKMRGGTQQQQQQRGDEARGDKEQGELGVGELEGAQFKVEPLRRSGEDIKTMRARLLYQSRKRGTLESDLLLSTFADVNLAKMSAAQLQQYDLFLDENDWDIYYWATQEPSPTSKETAEGSLPEYGTPTASGVNLGGHNGAGLGETPSSARDVNAARDAEVAKGPDRDTSKATSRSSSDMDMDKDTDHWRSGQARSGEWAQTVGAFKPAYRPVPQRWKNSEILSMLRRHVVERSAGGLHILEAEQPQAGGDGFASAAGESVVKTEGRGGGLGSMPEVRNF